MANQKAETEGKHFDCPVIYLLLLHKNCFELKFT